MRYPTLDDFKKLAINYLAIYGSFMSGGAAAPVFVRGNAGAGGGASGGGSGAGSASGTGASPVAASGSAAGARSFGPQVPQHVVQRPGMRDYAAPFKVESRGSGERGINGSVDLCQSGGGTARPGTRSGSPLHRLDAEQKALLALDMSEIVHRYLARRVDPRNVPEQGSVPDYERLAGNARFAAEMAQRPAFYQRRLRTALEAAESLGRHASEASAQASRERPDLQPFIERVVMDDIEHASLAIIEGRDLATWRRTPLALIEHATRLRAEHDVEASCDDQRLREGGALAAIRNTYALTARSPLLGVPFADQTQTTNIARGVLTFKGPNALYDALKFAPRADERYVNARFDRTGIPAGRMRLGPVDAPIDEFSPLGVLYELPNQGHLDPNYPGRYHEVQIIGGAFTVDGGVNLRVNPFPTNDTLEAAKLQQARSLIASARRLLGM